MQQQQNNNNKTKEISITNEDNISERNCIAQNDGTVGNCAVSLEFRRNLVGL